jgi:hypothetical protein
MAKFRHYLNLGLMPGRMRRLLRDFEWGRVDRVFARHIASSELVDVRNTNPHKD